MMQHALRIRNYSSLVFCFLTSGVMAADPVKYQFDGWTVTVAPRRTISANAPRELSPSAVSPSNGRAEDETTAELRRIQIRPVSRRQNPPVPAPNGPAPEQVELKLNSQIEPTSFPAQNPGIPSPTGHESYGGDPIIIPRPDVPSMIRVAPPQTAMYREIYESIPFNRAEYNAYPSYRHDATMEFLFNQMRPTVIQRGTTNVNHFGYGGGFAGAGGLGPGGYPYTYPYQPYYPFSYGLRLHRDP